MKKSKLINLYFNTLFLLVFCTSTVFAGGEGTGAGTGVSVPGDVVTTLTGITEILLLIGTAVCVGKLIHIGILYLTSTAIEKSNAKQALFPWILGTIICFGAATIGGAVIKLFLNSVGNGPVLGI